jgi:hypothetical protein
MGERLAQDARHKANQNYHREHSAEKARFGSLVAGKEVPAGVHNGGNQYQRYYRGIHIAFLRSHTCAKSDFRQEYFHFMEKRPSIVQNSCRQTLGSRAPEHSGEGE